MQIPEEQLKMIRDNMVMQFGEENGEHAFQLQKRVLELSQNGETAATSEELEKAVAEYTEFCKMLSEKMSNQSFVEDDDDDDDDDDYDEEYDDDDDDDDEEDGETVGLDAINEALEKLYGDQEGSCYSTNLPYYLGGNDPLDMVRIFESNSGGIPHWHYITYGFTELYGKETDDDDESGFGFELTFRLKKNEDEPPVWPVNLLQNVARYVFKTGNVFAPGHHMSLNGPIQLGYDTDITALAFIEDSELPEMDTDNGYMQFVQMVGITKDELDAVMIWNCRKLIDEFNKITPMGITDLDRKSYMNIKEVAEAFEAGAEADGSSSSHVFTDFASVSLSDDDNICLYGSDMEDDDVVTEEAPTIYIGAGHIGKISKMLKGRILKDRPFLIITRGFSICFEPSDECKAEVTDDDKVTVYITKEAVLEIGEKVAPKVGVYEIADGKLLIKICKTIIKDQDGNVAETIG